MKVRRILIIEDNKEWQGLIRDVLDPFRCEIDVVSSYPEAQAALQRRSFEIITLDMELDDIAEGLSGWPLLRMLARGRYPGSRNAQVIVLSGSTDFQEYPDKVDELRTRYSVERFLWKGSYDWDDKLYETVNYILELMREAEESQQEESSALLKSAVATDQSGTNESQGDELMPVTPEVQAQTIMFLFDIGRWAAAELKERWRLRHEKQEDTVEVDLSSSEEEKRAAAGALLREAISQHDEREVANVLNLVQRKHKLIHEWREQKIDNEEEYNLQRITRGTLRARQAELDSKIEDTMRRIEHDLMLLDISVEKQPVSS